MVKGGFDMARCLAGAFGEESKTSQKAPRGRALKAASGGGLGCCRMGISTAASGGLGVV